MATIKAKKGNPFEYDVMYSLKESGFTVMRPDSNIPGIDIIAEKSHIRYYVECKNHQKFSINELLKIHNKTKVSSEKDFLQQTELDDFVPVVIFKGNRQPVMIFLNSPTLSGQIYEGITIRDFDSFFQSPFKKRPKGYTVRKLLEV